MTTLPELALPTRSALPPCLFFLLRHSQEVSVLRTLVSAAPILHSLRGAMKTVFEIIAAFLVLGAVEAVVKPIARQFVRRRVMKHAPAVLERLDFALPELVRDLNGAQLEDHVRGVLEELTGESWANADVEPVFRLFDPRVTADRVGH